MPPARECPPGKILNPATNRCVDIDGRVGREVLRQLSNTERRAVLNNYRRRTPNNTRDRGQQPGGQQTSERANRLRAAAATPLPNRANVTRQMERMRLNNNRGRAEQANAEKSRILRRLQDKCYHTMNGVSLEEFEDLPLEELKNIVMIGSGAKKSCFQLSTAYNIYKTAVEKSLDPVDPYDEDHVFTEAERADIDRKMRRQDPSYQPPVPLSVHVSNLRLRFQNALDNMGRRYFAIWVENVRDGTMTLDLGAIPADIEVEDTGSTNLTSAAVAINIETLWNRALMFYSMGLQQWNRLSNAERLQRFIRLANDVEDAVIRG